MTALDMKIIVPGSSLSFRGGFFGFSAVVLLRHPDAGYILFDTGHHSTRHLLLAGLARAGVSAAEIGTVFLSHLHFDHVGNAELFEGARFLIPAAEWAYWQDPPAADLFGSKPINAWLAQQNPMFLEQDGEIAPGLFWRHAPGHTGGIGLLHFRDEAGRHVVIAGDACKTYRELVTGQGGEAYDPLGRTAGTLAWIRETADVVVCGHHPVLTRNGAHWVWDELTTLELIAR